ncbi:hypothetical protein KW849_02360 [Pseudomonas sp. PDM26]|uniref:hypothetical protein n=1 Tax=Pseudomonas sp. PDM26 TaxID=2854766 RepID=UPI001C448F3D|nr:hypothetical protein [Pseudomonas sp. PDM26]MBV7545150.1 hypothetical protein [Pseudomonas sp. PDM26]
MCNPLIIVLVNFLSRALPAVWKRSPCLPMPVMEMAPGLLVAKAWTGTITACRRSNLPFNRGAPASKLLTREGQGVEVIVGFQGGQEDVR